MNFLNMYLEIGLICTTLKRFQFPEVHCLSKVEWYAITFEDKILIINYFISKNYKYLK